jgi:hypothetical protein
MDSPHSHRSDRSSAILAEDCLPPITSYELAVLATLFEQCDCDKVLDLARQWGYSQEFLQQVWQQIHATPPP